MTLRPESLPALEHALVKATGWEARAERLFNDSKPPFLPSFCMFKPPFSSTSCHRQGIEQSERL